MLFNFPRTQTQCLQQKNYFNTQLADMKQLHTPKKDYFFASRGAHSFLLIFLLSCECCIIIKIMKNLSMIPIQYATTLRSCRKHVVCGRREELKGAPFFRYIFHS